MTNPPREVFLVSHTHWDREWYLTASEFRVDLTRVLAGVLDALERDPEFEHFVMDGQAIALEDHLALRPEDAPRIEALCRAGELSLGPWYVLPDEFLVSGEAMARNLLIGHQVCARFGGAQKVGYLPDSFGHFAQLPQLLRQAGIDSFIYTRGNGDEIERLGHEYVWAAPDGSEVLAVNQCRGYCNAGGLGFEEIWHAHTRREVKTERAVEQVGELFEHMAPLSRSPVRLLNNGCDHFPVQRDFGRVLAALRAAFPDVVFRHGGFADYLAALRASGFEGERFAGELLGGKLHHILSGVWSARMPLKQANDRCQHLLARVLEPALASLHFLDGQDYPAGTLHDAWKRLLANHPHDSICGCSTDAVHREMMPRFAGVAETAERLLGRGLTDVAPRFGRAPEGDRGTVITVFNPLPRRRDALVERLVVLQPFGEDPSRLRLFDETGRQVPCEFVESWLVERFWGVDYRERLHAGDALQRFASYRAAFGPRILRPESEADAADRFLHLRFLARDLPACGHAAFTLRESDEPAVDGGFAAVAVTGDTLDNGLLRVTLHPDGRLDLLDHRDGRRYAGLNRLVDDEDAGDEYDHSHCAEPSSVTTCAGAVSAGGATPLRAELIVRCALELPLRLAPGRARRVAETVTCPLELRVALEAGGTWVDIAVEFDNRAEDHRLRAEFPAGIATDRVLSDGHYLVVDRPLAPPAGEDWVQPHPGTYPQQDYSLLRDARGGLALLTRGLPEIMPRGTPAAAGLSLTLLRAVGWLSRDDFPSRRRSNAGPTLPTPEAQCPGRQRFRYALLPFQGDPLDADVRGASECWRTPPPSIQGVDDGRLSGGRGLVESLNPRCAVTAIKRAEDRESLIVRLVNLDGAPTRAELELGLPAREVWRCDLLEEREERLADALMGSRCSCALPAHRILTLEFVVA